MANGTEMAKGTEMSRKAEIVGKYAGKWTGLMAWKITDLQSGRRKPWLAGGRMGWPVDLAGREYDGVNAVTLMILCEREGYRLPVFCTRGRVAGLNRPAGDGGGELPEVTVNEGAEPFPVFLTALRAVSRESGEEIKYVDYEKLPLEERRGYDLRKRTRVYNVFNVAQTNLERARPGLYAMLEGRCRPAMPASAVGGEFTFPAMDEIIGRGLWLCPMRPSSRDEAYYSVSRDEIVLPEKPRFESGEAFYGAALHEMAHSTGAGRRLGRLKPGTYGSAGHAREELVAELCAALVASRYGIVKYVKDDSAAYLKSWLDSLRESPAFIKDTLLDVRRAASLVAGKVDEVALRLERDAARLGKVYYSSVALLQSSVDTSRLDALREKGDYDGLLRAAKEHYDGNGINERYTYPSPTHGHGGSLLVEDGDFAVVYNGSAGGTYELMLKLTGREIRDHVLRYGVDRACDTLRDIAKEMSRDTV